MNNERRKQLRKIEDELTNLEVLVDGLKDEEQEAFDNMPEGIQESERGEAMTYALESLDEAIDAIQIAYAAINNAGE